MKDFKQWAKSKNVLNEFYGPMSQAGFLKMTPHGEYQSKNFDRYPFKPDEAKALEYVRKMKNSVYGDLLENIEALAGFYNNDAIVQAYDDFLSKLKEMNIVI